MTVEESQSCLQGTREHSQKEFTGGISFLLSFHRGRHHKNRQFPSPIKKSPPHHQQEDLRPTRFLFIVSLSLIILALYTKDSFIWRRELFHCLSKRSQKNLVPTNRKTGRKTRHVKPNFAFHIISNISMQWWKRKEASIPIYLPSFIVFILHTNRFQEMTFTGVTVTFGIQCFHYNFSETQVLRSARS